MRVTANTGKIARLFLLAGIAALVGACGGGGRGTSIGSVDDASMALESPQRANAQSCSYQHVYLTVERVRALQQTATGEQWIDMTLAAPRRIDLAGLSGGVLQALGAPALAPGTYTQLRLVLVSNEATPLANAVQPSGGTLAPLAVPSGSQSGLKLAGEFTVPTGQAGDVTLTGFEPCEAVVVTGPRESPRYQLKPQIAASVQLGAAAAPETTFQFISGIVWPLPGGGYVISTRQGPALVLQRYSADGQAVGPIANILAGDEIGLGFAPLAGGGYAVVWLTRVASQPVTGIYQLYAQSFTATGAPVGSPVPVAQVNPGAVSRPAAVPQVTALPGGGFVVVWGLVQTMGSDTLDTGVHVQRFNADGTPAGSAHQVIAEGGSGHLGVTGLAGGGYLVTWGTLAGTSGGARAYSSTGEPVGPVQAAGSSWAPTGSLGAPPGALAPLTGGGAVLVWQSAAFGPLMVQQLAPDGTPLAAQVVNDATASPTFTVSAVGALPDGGYVVAWVEVGGDLYARRYAADGSPRGPQTRVNVVTTSPSTPIAILPQPGGAFTIEWSGVGTDGVRRNYARVFPADGLVAP